jgi:hypothetical protein
MQSSTRVVDKRAPVGTRVEFKERIDITINNTIMIIGQINEVYVPEDCLCEDGFLDLEKANTITCSGLDSYHKTQKLDRLSYAKPDKDLTSISTGALIFIYCL